MRHLRYVRFYLILFLIFGSWFFSLPTGFAKEKAEPEFVVKNGYRLGEGTGYCDVELIIEGRKITLRKSGQSADLRYPPVEITRYLQPSEYNILRNLLEVMEFSAVQDKYGCLDCHGRSTEWLEVVTPQVERRIEMEGNAAPVSLQSLRNFLRKLRARVDKDSR